MTKRKTVEYAESFKKGQVEGEPSEVVALLEREDIHTDIDIWERGTYKDGSEFMVMRMNFIQK